MWEVVCYEAVGLLNACVNSSLLCATLWVCNGLALSIHLLVGCHRCVVLWERFSTVILCHLKIEFRKNNIYMSNYKVKMPYYISNARKNNCDTPRWPSVHLIDQFLVPFISPWSVAYLPILFAQITGVRGAQLSSDVTSFIKNARRDEWQVVGWWLIRPSCRLGAPKANEIFILAVCCSQIKLANFHFHITFS